MFVIRVSRGSLKYVAGFSENHQVVVFCEKLEEAKVFSTYQQALGWISDYTDVGYGFELKDVNCIVNMNENTSEKYLNTILQL